MLLFFNVKYLSRYTRIIFVYSNCLSNIIGFLPKTGIPGHFDVVPKIGNSKTVYKTHAMTPAIGQKHMVV